MKGKERLDEILNILRKANGPISGDELSRSVNVSRQIIVQDINKLKQQNHRIFSTSKGYVLDKDDMIKRIVKVYHKAEDIEKELNIIVDLGGQVEDVFIYHKVYDEIHAKLGISSRRDVKTFINKIESGLSKPLSMATNGYHYHTILAKDNDTLDLIEKELEKNGFIAKLTDYEPGNLCNKKN